MPLSLPILFILFIGVQILTSCSSDDNGEPPSSSSIDGDSSSSGDLSGNSSSSVGDGSSSSVEDSSSSSVEEGSSSSVGGDLPPSSSSDAVIDTSSSSSAEPSSSSIEPSSSSNSDESSSSVGGSTCNADFRIVEIGTQVWMAENLNCDVENSRCYNNLESNCDIYGRLYDWVTAMTVCPDGWHIPSRADWEVMTAYIGGAGNEARKLKATNGWINNSNGTDQYGFSALPGGVGGANGSFEAAGHYSSWWSADEHNSDRAYSRVMYYNYTNAYWEDFGKSSLRSVRCVKN